MSIRDRLLAWRWYASLTSIATYSMYLYTSLHISELVFYWILSSAMSACAGQKASSSSMTRAQTCSAWSHACVPGFSFSLQQTREWGLEESQSCTYLLTRSPRSSTNFTNSSFVQLPTKFRMASLAGDSPVVVARSDLTWVHASRYT